MVTIKTLPYVKSRVLATKRLLDKALLNVNRYGQALLQYQSDQQQAFAPLHRPEYSQKGSWLTGGNAQTDAKAIDKINRLGSRLTTILNEMMILLKSKSHEAIYTKLGAILYYLDFVLDPFLRAPSVASLNTWSGVDVRGLTTNPLGPHSLGTMLAQQKKKTAPTMPSKGFSLLKGSDATTMFQGGQKQQATAPLGKKKSSLSSVLSLGLVDFSKPKPKKRARTQQQ